MISAGSRLPNANVNIAEVSTAYGVVKMFDDWTQVG